jgi:hypothetical protein
MCGGSGGNIGRVGIVSGGTVEIRLEDGSGRPHPSNKGTVNLEHLGTKINISKMNHSPPWTELKQENLPGHPGDPWQYKQDQQSGQQGALLPQQDKLGLQGSPAEKKKSSEKSAQHTNQV